MDEANLCPLAPKVGVVWAWLANFMSVVGGWGQCPRTSFQKVGAYVSILDAKTWSMATTWKTLKVRFLLKLLAA